MSTDLRTPDPSPAEAAVARGRDALERLRPQMAMLTPTELSPMNVDVTLAVSRALGVAPAVTALRDRIRTDCPAGDQQAIDELEDRAYALSTAHAALETSVSAPRDFDAVISEAIDARGVLLSVGRGLVSCNLLKAEQLGGLNGGRGYRETADDLIALTHVYTEHWSQLEGKVPFQQSQLTHAQAIAERLLMLLGLREQAPERAAPAADLRARAFTLLDRAYDEVRRAITFLRWREDDADAIAPPLRTQAGLRRAGEKNPKTDAAPNPVADPSAPGANASGGTSPKPVDGGSNTSPSNGGATATQPATSRAGAQSPAAVALPNVIGRSPSGASLGPAFTDE